MEKNKNKIEEEKKNNDLEIKKQEAIFYSKAKDKGMSDEKIAKALGINIEELVLVKQNIEKKELVIPISKIEEEPVITVPQLNIEQEIKEGSEFEKAVGEFLKLKLELEKSREELRKSKEGLEEARENLEIIKKKDMFDYLNTLSTEEIEGWKKELVEEKDGDIEENNKKINQIEEYLKEKAGQEIIKNTIEESVDKEDKNILDGEFEEEKSTESKFSWIKNKIVDYVSGIKMMPKKEKVDDVLYKASKYFLRTGLIAGAYFSISAGKVDNNLLDRNLKEEGYVREFLINNHADKNSNKSIADMETFKMLNENCKNIYLYNATKGYGMEPYVIVDKPTACAYIFDEHNKLISKFPVLLGRTKGEAMNQAKNEDSIPTAATTPMGTYRFGKKHISKSDIKHYQGRIFSVYGLKQIGMHETYPDELVNRTKALNSDTPSDNRMSWGCINISQENFDKYISTTFSGNNKLYITPDDENAVFTPSF